MVLLQPSAELLRYVPTTPKTDIGHFFMAIDPAIFRGAGDFESDVATFLGALWATSRSTRHSR